MAKATIEILTEIRDSVNAFSKLQKSATKSINQVEKSTTGLTASLRRAGEAALGFLARDVLVAGLDRLRGGFDRAIDEAIELENALIGLKSVAEATGNDINFVEQAAIDLSADGLIPLSQVSRGLKNLLATGLDAPKAVKVFEALRDAAAFNRQGQLELGEAVVGATDGIKNQLSRLVDNAGITKNLSILQREYASTIGTTVGRLSESQKVQAIANGVIREAQIFQGDYNKVLELFSGTVSRNRGETKFLYGAIGSLITQSPTIIRLTQKFNDRLKELRVSINENAEDIREFASRALRLAESAVIGFSAALFILAASRLPALTKALFLSIKNLVIFTKSAKAATLAAKALLGALTLGLAVIITKVVDEFRGLSDALGSTDDAITVTRLNFLKFIKQIELGFFRAQRAVREFARTLPLIGQFVPEGERLNKAIADQEKLIEDIDKSILKYFEDIEKANRAQKGLTDSGKKGFKDLKDAIDDVNDVTPDAVREFNKLRKELNNVGKSRIDIIREESERQAELIRQQEKDAIKQADLLERLAIRTEQLIRKEQRKTFDAAEAFRQRIVQQAIAQPLLVFDEKGLQEQLDRLEPEIRVQVEAEIRLQRAFGAIAGVLQSTLQGAEGARELVAGVAGTIASIIPALKPFAGLIQNFVRELSKGPEFIRMQVNEFANALPEILRNIPEAANEFTLVILERLPDILIGIIEAAVNSLASGVTLFFKTASADFLLSIVNSVPEIIDSFIDESGRFIDTLTEGAVALIENLVSRAPELITKLVSLVPLVIQRMASIVPIVIFRMAALIPTVISKLVSGAPRFITSLVKQAPLIGRAILEEVTGVSLIRGLLEGQAADLERQIEDIEIERDLAEAQLAELELQTTIAKQQREDLRERVQALDPETQLGQITDLNKQIGKLDDTIIKNGEHLVAVRQQLEDLPKQQQQLEKELADERGRNIFRDIFGNTPGGQAGGQVPQGFDNDRFLARLSSGENILDRSLSNDLRAFLLAGGQQQPQRQPIVIQIGSRTIAREIREEIDSGRVVNL